LLIKLDITRHCEKGTSFYIFHVLNMPMKAERKLFDEPELDRMVKEARRRKIFSKVRL